MFSQLRKHEASVLKSFSEKTASASVRGSHWVSAWEETRNSHFDAESRKAAVAGDSKVSSPLASARCPPSLQS
jgi:hypothetical protein